MGYSTSKLWNAPLKNGGSSNMAVNGSVTPQTFTFSPSGGSDFEVQTMCLIAEFTGAVAIGNKFLADTIGTLANGLLIEAKVDDVTYTFCASAKRTRDLIEVSQPQGGFNIIAGTTSLIQIFFYLPARMKLAKAGTFSADDYVRAVVSDNLSGLTILEIFLQGIKL